MGRITKTPVAIAIVTMVEKQIYFDVWT